MVMVYCWETEERTAIATTKVQFAKEHHLILLVIACASIGQARVSSWPPRKVY